MTSSVNYNDVLSAYCTYPWRIRPTLLFADTQADIRSKLTKTTRLAFLDLVARLNLDNPLQPIMVRVDQTALKLGISEKSVSRTIRLMRKNGWIELSNAHDGRNNRGKFAWKEYLFTDAFRVLMKMSPASQSDGNAPLPSPTDGNAGRSTETNASVNPLAQACTPAPSPSANQTKEKTIGAAVESSGLSKALAIVERLAKQRTRIPNQASISAMDAHVSVEQPQDNSGQVDQETTSEPKLSSGLIYAVNKLLKKEASFQKAASENEALDEKASNPENQTLRKQARVPASLREMCELLGILPEGICSLIALAKQRGHWLQDVWKAKKEVILNSGAKGGRAVKYIRFLLTCGDDYSYLARTKIDSPVNHQANQSQPQINRGPHDLPATSTPTTGQDSHRYTDPLEAVAKASRYKRFRHVSNGVRVRVYDGSAEVISGLKSVILGGSMQMWKIYDDIARGNLVEIRE